MAKEVKAGIFRSGLFHRLTAYPIQVPALRERGNDVALLAGYFVEQIRRRLGIQHIKFAPEVTHIGPLPQTEMETPQPASHDFQPSIKNSATTEEE